MYGALLRNGGYLAFGTLFAAVINTIISPFLTILKPAAQGSQYYRGLEALNNNYLLIIILAIAFAVIARAVVEANLPGDVR